MATTTTAETMMVMAMTETTTASNPNDDYTQHYDGNHYPYCNLNTKLFALKVETWAFFLLLLTKRTVVQVHLLQLLLQLLVQRLAQVPHTVKVLYFQLLLLLVVMDDYLHTEQEA